MENLKIKVNSEAESKEVQELLFSIGRTHDNGSKEHYQFCFGEYPHFINCGDEYISASRTGYLHYDEITLPQLRDLVVLKRNNVGDATHKCETPNERMGYLSSDGSEYLWGYSGSKWFKPEKINFNSFKLKPIIKPLKEYLDSNRNYEFVLSTEKDDGFIEIPELSQFAVLNGDDEVAFYDGNGLEKSHFISSAIIWQREQDEPFLTPETTLNDQYAEIEEVRQAVREEAQAASGIDATLAERQSQYGCYEDVAHVTQEILKALRVGGYDRMPAPHKEAMHMIASKMARIVNGDFNHLDSWHDIGGYAKLIEKLIKGE